jgi:hypothetical protein
MARSQESTTSSGYWSSQSSTPTTVQLNPHYLCYWVDSCNGQHELNRCPYWDDELRGKLGIYYSPSGTYELFTEDRISGVNLENNNTGCTKVHLLVYNDEKKEVLFGLRWCKESKNDLRKRPLLAFPSAQPRRRSERMIRIPPRAFEWLTTDTDFAEQCLKQGLKNRFLFQNANVIYPVYLTNEQASRLTQSFVQNEEFRSLHWFPLSQILSQLPPWPNYIKQNKTENELAQIRHDRPTGIQLGRYELWSVTAMCLMCIREHVPGGFDTFLKV